MPDALCGYELPDDQPGAPMTGNAPEPLDTWAIVEAMGHRTLIGRITEAVIAGKAMLHVITIAGGEHYLPPESLYCLTPCTQEQATRAASRHWGGLPPALAALAEGTGDDDEDPYTEAGRDYQRAEMAREDRRNEDHDDEDPF